MKAILLCAGQGTRLRPMTDDRPKGMVVVGGTTILERQLSQFRALGVDDIVVIGGYRHDTIPEVGLTKRVNEHYETTNMVVSLFAAAADLDDCEEVIVSYGDILYSTSVLESVLDSPHAGNVVIDLDWLAYFSARNENVLDDAESLALVDGCITSIGAKVETVEEIEGQYIGLMKFDRTMIEALTSVYQRARRTGEEIGWGRRIEKAYMTDLLQQVINEGHPLHAVPINGGWCEIDTPYDFELAEAMLPELDI